MDQVLRFDHATHSLSYFEEFKTGLGWSIKTCQTPGVS